MHSLLDKVEAHYTQLYSSFTLTHPGDHSVVYEDFPYVDMSTVYASSPLLFRLYPIA